LLPVNYKLTSISLFSTSSSSSLTMSGLSGSSSSSSITSTALSFCLPLCLLFDCLPLPSSALSAACDFLFLCLCGTTAKEPSLEASSQPHPSLLSSVSSAACFTCLDCDLPAVNFSKVHLLFSCTLGGCLVICFSPVLCAMFGNRARVELRRGM